MSGKNVKGTSKNSLSMLSERDFAEREKWKPRHTLLYGKAFVTKRFGNKIAAQREIGIFRGTLKYFVLLLLLILHLPLLAQEPPKTAISHLFKSDSKYLTKIKDRGKLIVAMTRDDQYPFFYTTEDGSLVGLDVSIAKQIAANLQVGLEIDRSADSFNGLIPLVESEQVDIAISKLSRTLARAQRVLFSNPYIVFRQALLVNRIQLTRVSSSDEETKAVIRQFSGKLGVIANSSYERYAKNNFPQADVVSFPTWDQTLKALSESEVFAVYRDEMEIAKYTQQNPQQNLYFKSVVIDDRQDPISVALPPDAYHFVFYINLFLASLDFLPRNSTELLEKFGQSNTN